MTLKHPPSAADRPSTQPPTHHLPLQMTSIGLTLAFATLHSSPISSRRAFCKQSSIDRLVGFMWSGFVRFRPVPSRPRQDGRTAWDRMLITDGMIYQSRTYGHWNLRVKYGRCVNRGTPFCVPYVETVDIQYGTLCRPRHSRAGRTSERCYNRLHETQAGHQTVNQSIVYIYICVCVCVWVAYGNQAIMTISYSHIAAHRLFVYSNYSRMRAGKWRPHLMVNHHPFFRK